MNCKWPSCNCQIHRHHRRRHSIVWHLDHHRDHRNIHRMNICWNYADICHLCQYKLCRCNCFLDFDNFGHMAYSIECYLHHCKDQFPNQQCKDSNPSSSRFLQYEYIGYLNENVLNGWVSADEMFIMTSTLTVCRDIFRDFAGQSSRSK